MDVAVPGRMQQHATALSFDIQRGQRDIRRAVAGSAITRRLVVLPELFATGCHDRHHRAGQRILDIAARVAGADVETVVHFVNGDGVPDGSATAVGLPAPEKLAVDGGVHLDGAEFRMRIAETDDHTIIEHARCAGDEREVALVEHLDAPDHAALPGIERDQPAIMGTDEQTAVRIGQPADARAAAQLAPGNRRDSRVVPPQ